MHLPDKLTTKVIAYIVDSDQCWLPFKVPLFAKKAQAMVLLGHLFKSLRAGTLAILAVMGASLSPARAAVPPGVWLMDAKVAVQVFECGALLCGRVIWLKAPLDPQGLLKRDKLNPDPALRDRQICGPTIIWNGQPVDNRHWENGWFYNADDGATYRVSLNLQSDDVLVARIYLGVPMFGKTKTLVRVPMGIGVGWC